MENNALVNGVLSFIIPGLGQALNGYKKKGIIMFVILILMTVYIYVKNYNVTVYDFYIFNHNPFNLRHKISLPCPPRCFCQGTYNI